MSFELKYMDTILKVNDKTEKRLTKRITYNQTDLATISIILPAKSTVLVGGSYNWLISIDSITLRNDHETTARSIADIYKKTERSGGIFPPYHDTYKIQ